MARANHINSGCTGMMGSGLWGKVELLTETRSFPSHRKRYQPLDAWRERLEKILEYYADLPESYGDVITYVVGSRDSFGKLR